MANDMLRLWDAIEPMAKATVERQTRDSVRVKQMVVTVAYNSTTKTVGVAEPFSNTIQIPVYGGIDPTALTVGTAVWVMCPYSSMSNAIVYMAGDGSLPGRDSLIARITALESAVNGMWGTIYPVGSLYISVDSTSPATLFGGTWVQIEDTFLLAAGQTYAAGDTGGEATHTLTSAEMPSHNHAAGTYTDGNEVKNWEFVLNKIITGQAGKLTFQTASSGRYAYGSASGYADIASIAATVSAGGGGAHNNMPPYLAVYVWKRTA